jgi:hypothetical protein
MGSGVIRDGNWIVGFDWGDTTSRACALRMKEGPSGNWTVTNVWYDDDIPDWIVEAVHSSTNPNRDEASPTDD